MPDCSVHGHDEFALPRIDGFSRRSPRRRPVDDGWAREIASLYRADSEGPRARLVLVPHASAWRELPTSARRHVGCDSDRGNRGLLSGAGRLAGACAGGAWPFGWDWLGVYRVGA